MASGTTVSGGVGDLQGDGTNDGSLSVALLNIQGPTGHEIPTLTVAGTMIAAASPPSNTSSLSCLLPCPTADIRTMCSSPLAANLTPLGWPNVFSGQPSAAVVPLNSQWNGNSGEPVVSGVIQSAGLEDLDFTGPGELDVPDNSSAMDVIVVGALNASVNSSLFTVLP